VAQQLSSGPYAHLAGHAFPGGIAKAEPWQNQLWCDAVCARDTAPLVHPMLAYYIAVEGAGFTFQDFFDLLDGDADSGIVAGEQSLAFEQPLYIRTEYAVTGEIKSVVRKSGRRTGPFDIATFELRLRHEGVTVATTRSSFVFPRADVT
jgi:hypothetical protein